MGLLYDLKGKYQRISIVGMAKNAGKTTALNYLIEEAMDEGMILGITSTGRDGESTDLVTGTEKPRVFLDEGTLVSVPRKLYDLSEAGLEILKMTNYRTSLGEIFLCKVVDSGYVQIAGPVSTVETKKLSEEMIGLGCEMIIIDGAIDRKSIASPETSDGIILSTGAVLSRSLKKIVEETAHVVGLYGLECLENKNILEKIEENKEKILLIEKENTKKLSLKTGLNSSRIIEDAITEKTEYIYIPGAFTNSVIANMGSDTFKNITFIVKDPTKIFLSVMDWKQWKKKGFKLLVLENIKVAAVTVNPHSPQGYSFDHKLLKEEMEKVIPSIPVVDVRM